MGKWFYVGFAIIMVLTSQAGCMTNEDDRPRAGIFVSNSEPRVGEIIILSGNISKGDDGNILEYQWNFGDGEENISTVLEVNHSYHDPGYYNVSLIVMDKVGISDPEIIVIKVRPRNWYSNETIDHLIILPQQSDHEVYQIFVEIFVNAISFRINATNHIGNDVQYYVEVRDPNNTILHESYFNISDSSRHMRFRSFSNLTIIETYYFTIIITNKGIDPADTTYELELASLY